MNYETNIFPEREQPLSSQGVAGRKLIPQFLKYAAEVVSTRPQDSIVLHRQREYLASYSLGKSLPWICSSLG